MAIYWPTELPQKVDVQQFGTSLKGGQLVTMMESGPPKIRRKTSAMARPFSGMFLTDAGGYARLLLFYEDEVGGVLPFVFPDQILDGAPMLDINGDPVYDTNGDPVLQSASWVVMFAGPPEISARAPKLFNIGISLSIMP